MNSTKIGAVLALFIAFCCVSKASAQIYPGPSATATPYSAVNPVPATAGGVGPYASQPTPASSNRIVAEGDSYQRGGGATSCPGAVFLTNTTVAQSTGTCWTDTIARFYNAPQFNVAVQGTCTEYTTVSGSPCNQSSTTSGSLIQRYQNTLANLTASDFVYYESGINDVNAELLYGDTQVNPVTFAANTTTIVNAYAAIVGASHIVLGEIPMGSSVSARITAAFNVQIDQIAIKYGYRLAATSYTIQTCAVQYPSDGCVNTGSTIHPDDQGHANLAIAYENANYYNAVAQPAAAQAAAQSNVGNAGNSNTVCGYGSAPNATGGNDTACGYKSAPVLAGGGSNTLYGANTGTALVGGNSNTFVGTGAGAAVASTSSNSYGGAGAGAFSTGSSNSCWGQGCLGAVTSGGTHACVGVGCFGGVTLQANDAGVGYQACKFITGGSTAATSSQSVCVGASTLAKAAGDTNECVIGYTATGQGSNTCQIGNSSMTGVFTFGGFCPGNLTAVGSPCYYSGTGAPTFSAPSGSMYIRYDGATGSRWYANTSTASTSGTTWTALAAP